MSAVVMTARIAQPSPLFNARMSGFFWLMTIFTGVFSMTTYQRFIVTGDATKTAANLLANEQWFRLGVASDVVATACYLAASLFIYVVLKPVNRNIALLATMFSLAGCAISGLSFAFRLAPLTVLTQSSSAFTNEQLRAFAHVFIGLNMQAANIGFVFFGLHCVLIGSLILKSSFMPRIVGALMVFGGLGWLTFGFAGLVSPPFLSRLLPYIMAPGSIAELTLTTWLLVKGVNVTRWNEQAGIQ